MAEAGERAERREGRGRLSTIEMLPETADEHLVWANEQLRERTMPQTEILREFNARLADLGIKGVSKGAFSRYSIRVAIEMRQLEASRQITDAILSRMPPERRSDSTLAAIELLKVRVMTAVMNNDEASIKDLNQATLAVQRLSSTSLREAIGERQERKDKQDQADRAHEEAAAKQRAIEAAAAVEKIGTEAGLTADRIAAIRKGVLGIGG